MANNHQQVHDLAETQEFRWRFAAALAAYVKVVFEEDTATASHAERLVSAVKVMNDPHGYSRRLALTACAAVGGVMPSDAAFDQLVAQYWTMIAVSPKV